MIEAVTDHQLNAIMDIFSNYPKKIFIKNNVFCVQHNLIENKKDHIKKLKKFRNLFNNFFVDTKKTTYLRTSNYLKKIENNKDHLMYCIFYKKELIGQYGLKHLGKKRIELDNAIRFSTLGGRKLFDIIQKKMFRLIRKNNKGFNILIVVKKNNLSALKLHKKFKFKNAKLICDISDLINKQNSSYLKGIDLNNFLVQGVKTIK